MAVNEVVVNGVTELSLVNDTVSEDTLLEGATAHDASGKQITGKVVVTPVDSELNAESENAIQNKAVVAGINNAVNGVKEYANGIISNPNLLDNPDFSINQRGASGTITDTGYFVDRWKLVSGTVTIGTDKTLTLNGTIEQILESAVGNSVIASASAGTASYNNSTKTFTLTALGEKIAWAKLELGSVATAFVPPNPATELAKCQWYYRRVEQARIRAWGYTVNSIPFFVPYPEMRIRPTATIKGSPTISSMATTSYADFSCSVDWTTTTGCKIIALKNAHGLTDGLLHINSDLNVYIELSADL